MLSLILLIENLQRKQRLRISTYDGGSSRSPPPASPPPPPPEHSNGSACRRQRGVICVSAFVLPPSIAIFFPDYHRVTVKLVVLVDILKMPQEVPQKVSYERTEIRSDDTTDAENGRVASLFSAIEVSSHKMQGFDDHAGCEANDKKTLTPETAANILEENATADIFLHGRFIHFKGETTSWEAVYSSKSKPRNEKKTYSS
ncbi:hypothetical protein EUGRSUZ_J02357 [Eucalyptus grandis]|uniref:Uncharacterized protein n=2 Tax=Eucalyptus grandis TaxID=71139 RepID=A0ACC3J8I4_EUCGR|nr:hypothetical protein EUGRSUZ_J02357 [Eucalyptus grandis]